MPVMAYNLLESIRLLASVCNVFTDKCVSGHRGEPAALRGADRAVAGDVHRLAPLIGYDAAAAIAKEAYETGKTVRQVATEKGILDPAKLNELLDPRSMTHPT